MSEHKYKEAYLKGIDKGMELQRAKCSMDCDSSTEQCISDLTNDLNERATRIRELEEENYELKQKLAKLCAKEQLNDF